MENIKKSINDEHIKLQLEAKKFLEDEKIRAKERWKEKRNRILLEAKEFFSDDKKKLAEIESFIVYNENLHLGFLNVWDAWDIIKSLEENKNIDLALKVLKEQEPFMTEETYNYIKRVVIYFSTLGEELYNAYETKAVVKKKIMK